MDNPEIMEIFQPIRNIDQLHNISRVPVGIGGVTYKHRAVGVLILFNKLVDISIIHPFGNHCKPVFAYCHPKQRQDVRMPEVLPGDTLSAESLQCTRLHEFDRASGALTLRMTSNSLCTRKALIAT